MKLKNKNVVVTGGASGIGAAMCRLFAAQGAHLVVSDINLAAAQEIASEIGGTAIRCDVSKESEIIDLIASAEQALGDIDLFCSNAGFGLGEPSHAASATNDVWQKNWDVHVMAHVYASRALLPKMIERGDGYLVNTASAAGLLSQIGDAAYTATKHAAVAFAESLAISHADDGLKVSVICPQYVNTNILNISEEQRAKPMPGVLSAEECAQCVLEGIENEDFLITPHKEVREFMLHRASDPGRWTAGMRRYRKTLLDEDGKMSFSKIFDR